MILNVEITNRIAHYIPNEDGEKFVCGNSGNQVKFTFDEEWAAHNKKTARFIWNKKYFDVEFTGDVCEIPVIEKATAFGVGVYVGEEAEGEPIISSTQAIVPTELSIRCVGVSPNAGTGANYTSDAKGYAVSAAQSAANAKAYEDATADMGAEMQAYQAYYDTMCAIKNAGLDDTDTKIKITSLDEYADGYYGNYNYAMGDFGRVLVHHPDLVWLGDTAFSGVHANAYFTDCKLPPKLRHIGENAFQNTPLHRIYIPRNVESMDDGVFKGQFDAEQEQWLPPNGMEVVFDPKCKLKRIPSYCFEYRKIGKIELHEGLEVIEYQAFYGTHGYNEIKFPSTLKVIGDYSFSDSGTRTYDLTAFTVGIPFPTLTNYENFNVLGGLPVPEETVIKVVKGRKAELAAMTNWSEYANNIVEV